MEAKRLSLEAGMTELREPIPQHFFSHVGARTAGLPSEAPAEARMRTAGGSCPRAEGGTISGHMMPKGALVT